MKQVLSVLVVAGVSLAAPLHLAQAADMADMNPPLPVAQQGAGAVPAGLAGEREHGHQGLADLVDPVPCAGRRLLLDQASGVGADLLPDVHLRIEPRAHP